MDLADIRAARELCQKRINDALRDFSMCTGVVVTTMQYDRIDVSTISAPDWVYNVRLEVTL